MGKKVAVVIKDKNRHYEGFRTSLGLLLENHQVSMCVMDHEIDLTEEYMDYLEYIEEMHGKRFSNVEENVEKHSFQNLTTEELAKRLNDYEIVIPF